MSRNKYNPWGLGRRGAAPGPDPSRGPSGRPMSAYDQYQESYQGGAIAYSGNSARSPEATQVLQRQYGPIDLRDNRTEAEAIQIPTPNVQWGQLLIAIETEWRFGSVGGYNFDVLSPLVSVYGWNSGVKQRIRQAALNSGSGPLCWVWQQDTQFDQLTVGVLPFFAGIEPQGEDILNFNEITRMNFTAVWRYITSTPRELEIDQTFRDG